MLDPDSKYCSAGVGSPSGGCGRGATRNIVLGNKGAARLQSCSEGCRKIQEALELHGNTLLVEDDVERQRKGLR